MRYSILLLLLTVLACAENEKPVSNELKMLNPPSKKDLKFDWQGHRGARGLGPENTLPAFVMAIEHGVNTLEMDVVISKDEKIIVSHEPWISSEICVQANRQEIPKDQETNFNIYKMTAGELRQFDCGSKGNPNFADQKKMRIFKPQLAEIIKTADTYTKRKKIGLAFFNIEIKSKPEWDGIFTPEPAKFAELVMREVDSLHIDDRATIQSFDPRVLNEVRKLNAKIDIALLVENEETMEANLSKLDFTPQVYSPAFKLVTKDLVEQAHKKGIKVIPWTVNEQEQMRTLIALGVDGIITDYPNRKIDIESVN